jgi:hypothetical protein
MNSTARLAICCKVELASPLGLFAKTLTIDAQYAMGYSSTLDLAGT